MRRGPGPNGCAGATVLVVAPHPDDEAIGCGGTLRLHANKGDVVHIVFLTSGEAGGHGRDAAETARVREREARRAGAILGAASLEFWHEPDGALRARRQLVERLAARIAALRPAVVYAPHEREQHPDHRAAARAVRRAAAAIGRRSPDILLYEVWTPIERMDEIVDVTSQTAVKRRAIRAYRSQCAVLRFDEASLGLARWRGEMHCWPGGSHAEVFARFR